MKFRQTPEFPLEVREFYAHSREKNQKSFQVFFKKFVQNAILHTENASWTSLPKHSLMKSEKFLSKFRKRWFFFTFFHQNATLDFIMRSKMPIMQFSQLRGKMCAQSPNVFP